MAIERVLLDNPNECRKDIVYIGDTYNTDVVGANQVGLDVYNTCDLAEKVKGLMG